MENPPSIGEETHTEEGVTATPQVMKLIIIKSPIHNSNTLEYPQYPSREC